MKHHLIGALLSLSLLSALAGGEEAAALLPPPPAPADAANFYQSDAVSIRRVRFPAQFGPELAANLICPKALEAGKQYPAIIVGHPMGAVKEQSSMLYAQKLAERGFVTLALDLPFWGESGSEPRNNVSPELYAEAFSAAADYLRRQNFVAREGIGALGICGSGGFAISAAKIDPRLKAVATVSMYNMGDACRHGLQKSVSLEQRRALIAEAAAQRDVEAAGGAPRYTSGTVLELREDTPPVAREFYAFYRCPRGEVTPAGASPQTTTRPTLSSFTRFMNFYPFQDMDLIAPRPLLFISGSEAHSREFSEEAYRRASEPKELYLVPEAGHVDLYDRTSLIPFGKLENFFKAALQP